MPYIVIIIQKIDSFRIHNKLVRRAVKSQKGNLQVKLTVGEEAFYSPFIFIVEQKCLTAWQYKIITNTKIRLSFFNILHLLNYALSNARSRIKRHILRNNVC